MPFTTKYVTIFIIVLLNIYTTFADVKNGPPKPGDPDDTVGGSINDYQSLLFVLAILLGVFVINRKSYSKESN